MKKLQKSGKIVKLIRGEIGVLENGTKTWLGSTTHKPSN